MTIHVINEHRIDVPNDMQVDNGATGPGAYDRILYLNHEITTYETGQVDGEGRYTGPFAISEEGTGLVLENCESLEQAKLFIERSSEPKPHIVIIGNPVDGFTYMGPFSSHEAAIEHMEFSSQDDWWIAPLDKPNGDSE